MQSTHNKFQITQECFMSKPRGMQYCRTDRFPGHLKPLGGAVPEFLHTTEVRTRSQGRTTYFKRLLHIPVPARRPRPRALGPSDRTKRPPGLRGRPRCSEAPGREARGDGAPRKERAWDLCRDGLGGQEKKTGGGWKNGEQLSRQTGGWGGDHQVSSLLPSEPPSHLLRSPRPPGSSEPDPEPDAESARAGERERKNGGGSAP